MSPQFLAVTMLAFAATATAYVFSEPNCTLPHAELHNFVSAPSVRGTLEILWSCLATIIACTYTVIHLNVPEQRDGRDMEKRPKKPTKWYLFCVSWIEDLKWWYSKGSFKWWWKGLWPTLLWTVANIIMPELYTYIAVLELLGARSTFESLQSLPPALRPSHGSTLTYGFYANMGGFAVRGPKQPLHQLRRWELLTLLKLSEKSPVTWSLPEETEIKARSKSDAFAKGLTILQVLYFCMSCLARAVRGLPITLLELGTLGFAACSVVSYCILFKKPRGVQVPITLPHVDETLLTDGARSIDMRRNNALGDPGNNNAASHSAYLLAIGFGAIHVAGWHFPFPSSVDQWLWRGCSVASMVLPLGALGGELTLLMDRHWDSAIVKWAMGLFYALYFVARAILIAEMIRCLFYSPQEIFATTWAANMPFFG